MLMDQLKRIIGWIKTKIFLIKEKKSISDKDFSIVEVQYSGTSIFLPGIMFHCPPFEGVICLIKEDGAIEIINCKNPLVLNDKEWNRLLQQRVAQIISKL